uniref:Uncharacterized protein n=1 Tax=Vespula pensylvanica TaxID=30213 RepID=A0A834NS29_VESPE|nr:hypothetical protein H0235_011538 [Vespula pensylvanica]
MARRGTKIYLVERADLEIDRESLLGAGQYGAALQWPAVPEVLCYVLAVIQIEVGRHSAPFAVAMGSGHCAQARNARDLVLFAHPLGDTLDKRQRVACPPTRGGGFRRFARNVDNDDDDDDDYKDDERTEENGFSLRRYIDYLISSHSSLISARTQDCIFMAKRGVARSDYQDHCLYFIDVAAIIPSLGYSVNDKSKGLNESSKAIKSNLFERRLPIEALSYLRFSRFFHCSILVLRVDSAKSSVGREKAFPVEIQS